MRSIVAFILLSLIVSVECFAVGGTAMVSGRFQLIQLSDMRRDQRLIDTQTGRVWVAVCAGERSADNMCTDIAWQEEFVQNLQASKGRLPALPSPPKEEAKE